MQALRSIITSNYSALTCCMRHHVGRQSAVCILRKQCRFMSAEPLMAPSPDGAPKVYPEKIQSIVSQISHLTLVEVADLNELLKKTLNISDAPEEEEEEAAAPAKVQTSFTLKMNKYDESRKVALIKEVKARLEGYNLVQAKKFVESCPCVVKADIPKDEAEQLLESFKAVGAECVIE
ncbi:39S ribosomal protein L12-like [Homarus americanus]|uniref:39S ribosomal protein L12-like n=1 Tax=Homarus americanus TaxID=6706 RepID=A0A8J5JD70_HOMAM|nr:39S ribosomal protein L12-like [Homarus americanus]